MTKQTTSFNRHLRFLPIPLLIGILLLLSGCGEKEETVTKDIRVEAEAYYAEHPDFFIFKTIEDLPQDLDWYDGSDLPEFASPDAIQGGTFNFTIQDFPRTLRLVGPDSNGGFRSYMLDDNSALLVHRHPNISGAYYPGLCNAYAISEDMRTVYFKLDPDARYSDGVPVTADDYLFAFFFYRTPYIKAPWYTDYATNRFTSITKYDDHHIAITIPKAKPDVVYRAGDFRPIPMHFFKELGDDFTDRYQWEFEPTTGAYEVRPENVKKGRYIALTRVENWWANDKRFYRNRFNPQRVHLQVIRDINKAFEAFKRGDLDYFGLNLPENWYEKLPNDDPLVQNGYIRKVTFYNDIPAPSFALRINSSKPLLDNRDIRVGIHYACNWDLVIEQVFRGDYERMRTTSDGYGPQTHPTLQPREFSVEKALEQFAKAGFDERGPDGILVNDEGKRLSFTITTGYTNLKDVMTILKQEAAKAGIEFNLEILDQTAGWKKVQEKKHDIMLTAFAHSVELYPRYWETFHSDNAYNPDGSIKTQTNNLTLMADPEMDALIEQYRASSDLDEMRELAFKMEEMIKEYGAWIPAFKRPWYRYGVWRYVGTPEGFNVKMSRYFDEYHVHWIDEEKKAETRKAQKEGKSFGPSIEYYDQFKVD